MSRTLHYGLAFLTLNGLSACVTPVGNPDVQALDLVSADVVQTGIDASDTGLADGGGDVLDGGPALDANGSLDVRTVDVFQDASATLGPVHVVLFTHIEDNTPAGTLGTQMARLAYLGLRGKLVEIAQRARTRNLVWVLQPDWKYLEAAILYEDASTTVSTNNKNVFRYLKEDLGAVIDPHSHENGGYNYTDVAHLLELLGVGGSTVIGGHIWDPALPQFQQWDRFRVSVPGEHYPTAMWRGDILIGAGTPNHVNDPLVSGVWRPQDKDHFFVDSPTGNVLAFGAWHDGVLGVHELVNGRAQGTIPSTAFLTASWNITPTDLTAPDGINTVDTQTFAPLQTLRDQGKIVITDFSTLAQTWRTQTQSTPSIYMP